MKDFVIVSAADSELEPVFASMGGRAISPRIGILPWWGTAEQLFRLLTRLIPGVVLVVSLNGDCFVGAV